MKPKTRFLKMYYKLPEKSRYEIYGFANHPMTLNVMAQEIRNDTKLGNEILKKLGYEE